MPDCSVPRLFVSLLWFSWSVTCVAEQSEVSVAVKASEPDDDASAVWCAAQTEAERRSVRAMPGGVRSGGVCVHSSFGLSEWKDSSPTHARLPVHLVAVG